MQVLFLNIRSPFRFPIPPGEVLVAPGCCDFSYIFWGVTYGRNGDEVCFGRSYPSTQRQRFWGLALEPYTGSTSKQGDGVGQPSCHGILACTRYGHHACFAQCCGGALGRRFQQPFFPNIRQSFGDDIFHHCTGRISFLYDNERILVREVCCHAYPGEIYKVQHHTADRSSTNVHRRNSQGGDHHYSLCLVLWGRAYSAQHHWCFHYYMRYAQYSDLDFDGFETMCITGIILFTYHKYRRSIESAVPLDGHGNPISTVDGIHDAIDEQLGEFVELGETVHLTSESRVSYDFEEVTWTRDGNRVEG